MVVQLQQLNLSSVLVVATSDGRVEFRERATMELLPADMLADKVSGLVQLGFSFADTAPCQSNPDASLTATT